MIPVKAGEVVTFEVTNTSGNVPHNFWIGPPDRLQANDTAGLAGIPDFTSGTQSVEWNVPEDAASLEFACTVTGHYQSMHGSFQLQP